MIIVLILISIFLLFVSDDDDFQTFCFISCGIKIVIMAILIGSIVNGRVIDEKIELIQNKNYEIEQKVELAVKTYMEFENKTFVELKGDSFITLVTLYPKLKSDEMIMKEIELYQNNINEITDLKKEKINISNYKWWVYFGK